MPLTQSTNPKKNSPIVTLALVRDLIFAGRISAEARAQNVAIELIRDPAQLAQREGSRLIVDLNETGALDAAAEWKQRTFGAVIGFVAHTDVETIAHARAAGFDRVLPRSAFVQLLAEILTT